MYRVVCFLFFILLNYNCYSSEKLNVEVLPLQRTQKYATGDYNKVVIISPARTGSSLIYNVCRFLFEKQENLFLPHKQSAIKHSVIKTHKTATLKKLESKKNKVLYILTIRNPINAIISNYRVREQFQPEIQQFVELRKDRHKNILQAVEQLRAKGKHVLVLKYEDFATNFDYIFTAIEDSFGISIAAEDKALIQIGYSKENIYRSTQQLNHFNEHLPFSGFHGNHVSSKKYTPPKQLLYWIHYYLPEIQPLYESYGYFLNEN